MELVDITDLKSVGSYSLAGSSPAAGTIFKIRRIKLYMKHLQNIDKEIYKSINFELSRQQNSIELIASENIVSKAVLEAQGSILTNKYAEGYPGRRYYGGCEFVDEIETLAIERVKKLFGAAYANVQPHSGSQANQAVFLSLLTPGDKILGMSLDCGGHLTHGCKVNMSGKWFESHFYVVDKDTYQLDYEEIKKIALKEKPKLLIAGGSAYPRKIDFKKFREIADLVGAYLLVDMAHIAGVVAAGYHENPMQYADIVTSTTHKTLRGPRGGIILTNRQDLAKKINSAIFPGLQGGPLMHVIAAKAVAFHEDLQDDFKDYIKQVLSNCQTLAKTLTSRGYQVLTGGTDNHLILVDLRNKNITGKDAEETLEKAGLTCNKNGIPFDDAKPLITSGIRLGTPAATTRGFKEKEFDTVGNLIADVLDALSESNNKDNNEIAEKKAMQEVKILCEKFPIYKNN
jgi:glycine hydroxymethyltransferase